MSSEIERRNRYLNRIGVPTKLDPNFETLSQLMRAHLATVPFENLDVYRGVPVDTDIGTSIDKIVAQGRGGWCFELNGAFAWLLDAVGFDVALLGAAVLLNGPSAVIDHLTLEVTLDQPYLVDVGFGDSFITPLRLNQAGPQDGGSGTFEFMASSQGTTLTRHEADGFPAPQFRFKRTHRHLEEFAVPSGTLQTDKSLHWHQKPIATRLTGKGPDRISLTGTKLARTVDGVTESETIDEDEVASVLLREFGIGRIEESETND